MAFLMTLRRRGRADCLLQHGPCGPNTTVTRVTGYAVVAHCRQCRGCRPAVGRMATPPGAAPDRRGPARRGRRRPAASGVAGRNPRHWESHSGIRLPGRGAGCRHAPHRPDRRCTSRCRTLRLPPITWPGRSCSSSGSSNGMVGTSAKHFRGRSSRAATTVSPRTMS